MTFSSLVFLCIFLPIVFCLHSLIPSLKVRNILLIVASLVFYAFGEPIYVFLMILNALVNYLIALGMNGEKKKLLLIIDIVFNIGILGVFKYTGFLVSTVNGILGASIPVPEISLPIGISFFTFQAMSYVIDAYRGNVEIQKNFAKVLLYISFFPQLIAGPIVKYRDIAEEIDNRKVELGEVSLGLRRFIAGLGKKVLIANAMAVAADSVFNQGAFSANIIVAWIGAIAYAMQIYFDFSGYSDMAIGLGRMFGFHFKENFLHPYGSVNIKEFWRRWHISLSSWFKEYVYIPLGGNRKGPLRAGINKVIVFFLTGLWHGANWTFVFWGLFHGAFSFLEEFVPAIKKLPRAVGHIYTMVVVIVGFVFFRAETIGEGMGFVAKMFTGFNFAPEYMSFAMQLLTPFFIVMLLAAVIGCAPIEEVGRIIRESSERELNGKKVSSREKKLQIVLYALSMVLLCWCVLRLSGGSYNPFIYFRF